MTIRTCWASFMRRGQAPRAGLFVRPGRILAFASVLAVTPMITGLPLVSSPVEAHPVPAKVHQVTFVNSQAEFTPASIETKDQRVKLVYQVKLDITNADANLKPGMPADVVLK